MIQKSVRNQDINCLVAQVFTAYIYICHVTKSPEVEYSILAVINYFIIEHLLW
jgi:hypothetical protein